MQKLSSSRCFNRRWFHNAFSLRSWRDLGGSFVLFWRRSREKGGYTTHSENPLRLRHSLRADLQLVCVTRFDQSERVICRLVVYIWNFAFQARVDNFDTIPLGKLLEHFILIVVALLFNILLSWAFATSLNYLVMCKPPWWFDCNFRRTSWIHSWLLVAVLSDYFGQLVTSTFLLCKFRGLPASSPDSFPVMRRWKCLGMKRLSQRVSQVPGNGLRNLFPTWSE